MSIKVLATNRKAWHEYHILEKYEGGIVLYGSEVKAIREGKANINDSYVRFLDNELYVIGIDRKSTRLNSSNVLISYAVF